MVLVSSRYFFGDGLTKGNFWFPYNTRGSCTLTSCAAKKWAGARRGCGVGRGVCGVGRA